jgi:hypothetical protein
MAATKKAGSGKNSLSTQQASALPELMHFFLVPFVLPRSLRTRNQ